MAWDLTDSNLNPCASGVFDEIIDCPFGNVVTGGGFAVLETNGSAITSDPGLKIWINAPNGSGSWRVRGYVSRPVWLFLYIASE